MDSRRTTLEHENDLEPPWKSRRTLEPPWNHLPSDDSSSVTQASCSGEDDPPDGCYTEIIKYVAHVARRARRRVVRAVTRPVLVRRVLAALGWRRADPDTDVEVVDWTW